MAVDAAPAPARRAKVRLVLGLMAAVAVLLVYLVVQPWPRPALVGSDVGISNAYVGNTYVCGDVVTRVDAGRWPVEVTGMSLATEEDVEAVLFAASRSSSYYDTGAGVYGEWPALDERDEVKDGFELSPTGPVPVPHRVKVAIRPRSLGSVDRFTAAVTYKYRWLPARTTKVDFTCQLEVTREGRDPRVD